MNREEIYEALKSLSKSQGFYGRLLEQVEDHPEILSMLEEQNFKDIVDLVMYLEQ